MHPKAREAEILAQIRKAKRIKVKGATKGRGLHFVIVHDHTFCYEMTGRIIKFSTSIRSHNDKPDLLEGKSLALDRFDDGAIVRFRLRKGQHPKLFFNWIIRGWIDLVENGPVRPIR